MSTKTLTIKGLTFTATTPFTAGHVLTEGEAKALNQVRLENLRNNFATTVAKAIEGKNAITEAEMADLVAKFAEYDAAYVFTLANVGTSRVTDPVEVEARKLARPILASKIAEAGKTRKDIADEVYEAALSKIAASEPVMKLARKNVADRQNAAKADLGDLGF